VLLDQDGPCQAQEGLGVGENADDVGAVLIVTHDEWQVSDRRDLSEGSTAQLTAEPTETGKEVAVPEFIAS